jgi:uncharacterized protein YlxW (UPF0749 family)
MEILENLQNEIRALSTKIEQVSKKVEQPPVVKIDTAKLATELTRHLTDHSKAMEDLARRIEAVASNIPRSVKLKSEKVHAIEWPTAAWLLLLVAAVAATGVFFLMTANPAVAEYLNEKNVETRAHLEYHIDRNPKTELGYQSR